MSTMLDQSLSSARPLPIGLSLKPDGSFLFTSLRKNRRTGALIEGTGVKSMAPTEQGDAESFCRLLKELLPQYSLQPYLSSRINRNRLAEVILTLGKPMQVHFVNGTTIAAGDESVSASELQECVERIEWDRIGNSCSTAIHENLHCITWHPYRQLTFRMGRRLCHHAGRRVVETVCNKWILQKKRFLGVVGSRGKTMTLRQLLAILLEYYSHLRVGVLSETGELAGGAHIGIAWQRNWMQVVQKSKIQVLLVDAVSINYKQLKGLGIHVAASGWEEADLLLQVQTHQSPWYRLDRQTPSQRLRGLQT